MSGFPQSDVMAVMAEAQACYEEIAPRYEEARRAANQAYALREEATQAKDRAWKMVKAGTMTEDAFDAVVANLDAAIDAQKRAGEAQDALMQPYFHLRFMLGLDRAEALAKNDANEMRLGATCKDGGGHELSIGTHSNPAGITLNCSRCHGWVLVPRLDAVLAIYDLARRLGVLGDVELLPDV